ncbi:hypothetical protein [Prosthecobacter vanneervenii]|uniref:Uncharacterized protein n=1 Tax=Prosthecobacter vanneervenii TaxID=48466 RepID=A0A7W7YE97_9BACT|nr:hypothetical protein [Prosthecobacter vanneervenii]MBB5034583.1 hypothetical protein [Prosthecobacter vanneervenii]
MSFPSSHATLPPPGLPAHSDELFANELTALAQEIQRTREWFNHQLDAQLARLKKLCAATRTEEAAAGLSTAMLFQEPHPELLLTASSAPAHEAQATVMPPPAPRTVPVIPQTFVLQPTLTASLDPELEQATLHELNNALSRAFAEISARGGMLDREAC